MVAILNGENRTDINETQYSGDGNATLCIAAANTTLNFGIPSSPRALKGLVDQKAL